MYTLNYVIHNIKKSEKYQHLKDIIKRLDYLGAHFTTSGIEIWKKNTRINEDGSLFKDKK